MKRLFLIPLLILISCGKHQPADKTLQIEPVYGEADPCANQECEIVDVVKMNDPTLLLRMRKYFPDLSLESKEIDEYELGDVFEFQMERIFNQNFNIPTQTYVGGCNIRFEETQIIYKKIYDLVDEEQEKFDRIVFKYERKNPVALNPTERCKKFIEEDVFFNEEATGFLEEDLYPVFQALNFKLDKNLSKEMTNIFIIRFENEYFMRIEYTKDNNPVSAEIYNPRTRRVEKVETVIDLKSISIQKPHMSFIKPYSYQEGQHKKKPISLNISRLIHISRREIDPAEIP